MATVTVSMLKSGERIIEDVHTPLGSLLFEKGRELTSRDIEILRAFMIRTVEIDAKQGEILSQTNAESDHGPAFVENAYIAFFREYELMYQLMKRVFTLARTGGTLPILELRTRIENMIKYIAQYHPLTFVPRNTNADYFHLHDSIMVGLTSFLLARWSGLPAKDWIPVFLAGLFHDIGYSRIDEAILKKPSRLTDREFEELKKHTVIGYYILKDAAGLNEGVKLSVLQHHERYDGSGYPLGIQADKIHVYAKIVAVSDMFHAMTTNRKYRKASSPYLVLEELFKEAFGKLDPELVHTFMMKLTQFHHGTVVKLSDNSIGEIVFTDQNNPTRPMVNVNGKIIIRFVDD